MAFNPFEFMKEVSAENAGQIQEQLEYIPFNQIVPDENNGYSMDGIEELAWNIQTVGLKDPLNVYPMEALDRGTVYKLTSGHRRRAAFEFLVKTGELPEDYPVKCLVSRDKRSATWREFELLMANADNRKMTDADLSQQLERLGDLLRLLEDDEGVKLEGRRRDWVAKLSGESRSKIARLQAIRSNLVPELLEMFDKGKLKTSAAYELQKLPVNVQKYLAAQKNFASKCKGYGLTVCAERQDSYLSPKCKCPDGSECIHKLPRFKQTATANWTRCDGGCCLKCHSSLSDCPYRCERSKKKIAAQKADDKKSEERARKEKEKLLEENRSKLTGKYMALEILARDAGLKDDDELPVPGCYTVADLHERAMGNGISEYTARSEDVWGEYNYVGSAVTVADALNVSVDFLLGRTPVPEVNRGAAETLQGTPARCEAAAPDWFTGEPKRLGRYMVLLRGNADAEDEPPKEFRADLREDGWYLFDRPMIRGMIVTAWYPLPEV